MSSDDGLQATYTRELLSQHLCTATFTGVEPGREPMLRIFPPQPPKQWATFTIEAYERHEKPGKYGDERQTSFAFVAEEQPEFAAQVLATLSPGARVKIAWRHDYVTRREAEGGGSSSYPERVVELLEML